MVAIFARMTTKVQNALALRKLLRVWRTSFKWQQEYTSHDNNRWVLRSLYVYSIEDAGLGVSVDIFNVETGNANVHGAQQVCCQWFAYLGGNDNSCRGVACGHKYCAGGDTDTYDACFAKFAE